MLVACLPLLVVLLVGLPFTFTAQTLDYQQLDISNALGTNPASPDDFGGEYLSKRPTRSIEKFRKIYKLRFLNNHNPEEVISRKPGSFDGKNDVKSPQVSWIPDLVQSWLYVPELLENLDNNSTLCPEPIDIAPCVCTETAASDLVMDCSAAESLQQLDEVFQKDFPSKQFYEFRIYDNDNIQYLADIFNGVSFTYINLQHMTSLTEISNDTFFDSIEYLEYIYIYHTSLDENTFPFTTLDKFPKLRMLSIGGSYFETWPAVVSSSISEIYLYENRISTVFAGEKCIIAVDYLLKCLTFNLFTKVEKIQINRLCCRLNTGNYC